VRKALEAFRTTVPDPGRNKPYYTVWTVENAGEEWDYPSLDEFLAAYGVGRNDKAALHESYTGGSFYFDQRGSHAELTVKGLTREELAPAFEVLESNLESCRVAEPPQDVIVFIGHGRDPQWRDLKDHLQDQHGYDIEAYEVGSRAGHTIRDILVQMLEKSAIALLVMTGEDEDAEGKLHARENVIHELGLFQGKLGFSRAIVLLEEGTSEFSNIHGIHQIRFPKGRIREAFGDVLAVLRREFG
jgi:predicted nucleotide-binding protein